ncbi:efflux transporter outer membrane subunit [Acetobacter sp.]|jgi:NodT family efflux transporter outer membrane factor (OMF) lipoprotein|uniref:efflux transporter outer membrane subunit n=1 Tax=Acetobacter sp. TaxID=440 RepID=UPI0025B83703|nr:efflux transporter outer membrane subunit [Acetobacter sp.]MCH4090745.1 efflux transporter outer membrane subunit [Acetobacter sp.]MCI1300539.1 efflux transporter outer membrane subunit [Acetobacter sp.]MCI1316259.1 efflux transporter outer membrane subunit [Acetobacter sp.]
MRPSFSRHVAFLFLATSTLTGCDLAPRYAPAKLLYPAQWEGQGVMRYGRPDDGAPRSDWWRDFGDPELDQLEERMLAANPDLQAAAESFTQSRDVAAQVASHLYPQVIGGASGEKDKSSRHRLWRGGTATGPIYMSSEQYQAAATWEPDFWNAIRNRTLIAKQSAQESAADYAVARLSLTTELASDYIALRGLDAQDAVYRDSIRYYELAVQITHMRLAGAIAAGLDVSRAEAQLASTQAEETDIRARRDVMEHAIAVLVNMAPASFHITPRDRIALADIRPAVGLPSTLLERRPDIAASERAMAQANRAIGVSRAAFYPHVTFNAMTGFMDNGFDLASLSNSMYQFGAQAILPLFQGGVRRAELQRSWSQYRQSEETYRSKVLSAFQEVEDGLTNTNRLRTETDQQARAVDAALRTQTMTMQLYTGGLTNYLDVVVAQQAALVARVGLVGVKTRQRQSVVALIGALGGGWSKQDLPALRQIRPFKPLQYDGLHTPKPVGDVPVTTRSTDSDLTGPAQTPVSQDAAR